MYQRGRFAVAVAAIVSCVVFPSLVRDGEAEDDTVRVEGRVAWIAGQKMVVAPPGRLPVSVDLSEVDQGEYQPSCRATASSSPVARHANRIAS